MAINNQIQKAIQTIVNRAIEIAPFDKTRTGIVKEVNNNGTYKVLIDGVEYPNVPIWKNQTAQVGDVVKVKYPSGNVSQMYICSGTGNGAMVVNYKTTSAKTIEANSTENFTIGVEKEGYTPIGIVGIYIGYLRNVPQRWSIDGNEAIIVVRNVTSTSSTSGTVGAYVLYQKNF